jgi:biotin transport system substrate-specific component
MIIATQPQTLVQKLYPQNSLTRDALLVVTASLTIGLLAQISIPLQPVPVTGQTLGVFLVALTLGWRLGGLAIGLYLLEAAVGLPVLAGFSGGLTPLTGATAGYLFGFLLAGLAVGFLADKGFAKSPLLVAVAMLIGTILIYIPGLLWLRTAIPALSSLDSLLSAGFTPFILGDAIKAVLAAVLLPSAWALLGKR